MRSFSISLFLSLFLLHFISCDGHPEIDSYSSAIIVLTPFDVNGTLQAKQRIKSINGIGNGPLYVYKDNEFTVDASDSFKKLNISIVRYHDVEYWNAGNKAVNISAIFPNPKADESDSNSYNFLATDQLLKSAMNLGCQVIFRLGENILNTGSATGSNTPPQDFAKWARIAERIIAHYEDGWNNGSYYKGIMWEIWNEPDVEKCWDGTFDSYCEFYEAVWQCIHAKHPNTDISPSYAYSTENRAKLYACIKENNLGIEHCFVHHYWEDFAGIGEDAKKLKQELAQYGLEADIILNEWNYLSSDGGWNDLTATFTAIQSSRSAAWCAKQLIHMQEAEDLAGAVYYISDMPGYWTGLYKLDSSGETVLLPTYDVFKYFGRLYKLGNEITLDTVPTEIYALAASDGKEIGIMVTNYSDKNKTLTLNINGIRIKDMSVRIKDEVYDVESTEDINVALRPYEVSYISIR